MHQMMMMMMIGGLGEIAATNGFAIQVNADVHDYPLLLPLPHPHPPYRHRHRQTPRVNHFHTTSPCSSFVLLIAPAKTLLSSLSSSPITPVVAVAGVAIGKDCYDCDSNAVFETHRWNLDHHRQDSEGVIIISLVLSVSYSFVSIYC